MILHADLLMSAFDLIGRSYVEHTGKDEHICDASGETHVTATQTKDNVVERFVKRATSFV